MNCINLNILQIRNQKSANRVKNYITRLPFDDVDSNQNNFHKIPKQSDGKLKNQPILQTLDNTQKRHQTPYMSNDKFMNRQLSHKHWGKLLLLLLLLLLRLWFSNLNTSKFFCFHITCAFCNGKLAYCIISITRTVFKCDCER